MDVRCSRCGTEYEFDDALISERGTTVKCTNCGYQFKIYPGAGKGLPPERWVVRTASGRELVYTSLRELQRGIADKKVGASDLLSRGKQPPRPLGSIAELEPFFQVISGRKPGDSDRVQRTLHGVAPAFNSTSASGRVSDYPGDPGPSSVPPAAAPRNSPITASFETTGTPPPAAAFEAAPATQPLPQTFAVPSSFAPDTDVSSTLPEVGALSATLPADFRPDYRATLPRGSGPIGNEEPAPPSSSTLRASRTEGLPDSARGSLAGTPVSPLVATFDRTLEVPVAPSPVSSPRNLPPIEVENIRDSFKSYDELRFDSAPDHHLRSARSRWIGGVVIVGVLGLLGATVGRRYLAQLAGVGEVKGSSDARVAQFLKESARLADEGDFESAKEELDKATALAEKDPAVLAALAHVETLRADVSWLKLRLLDPASTDLVQATYRELGRRVGKTRIAVDRAFAVSPEDPAILRARVDVLRLSGDADKAREWLGPLSANASVPENAYVLAALDLADPAPVWPTVIDRLRSAAAAERDPGRARAALIYALARASRVAEADAEFAKIDGRPKPHPLLEELRAFLKRADAVPSDAPSKVVGVDLSKLPKLDTSLDEPRAGQAPANAGDFRTRLAQANAALRQGELKRADQLFNSVLEEQPMNTEALSGVADVAKARNDPGTAARMYDRVLAQNPSYLPAILASADGKWEAGDRAGALFLYRRLLDQAGPSSEYGARAAARIAQANAAPATSASAEREAPTAPSPGVDTTDLPGTK